MTARESLVDQVLSREIANAVSVAVHELRDLAEDAAKEAARLEEGLHVSASALLGQARNAGLAIEAVRRAKAKLEGAQFARSEIDP